jgi:ribose transport system ATP-binding protein
MREVVLEIKNLNKFFGPTHANINISLTLKKGEVKGIIGENGSGKSTLISQIAGMLPRDSGQMLLHGREYNPKSPLDANEKKIAMVVQELGVIGNLPLGVNVYLGRMRQFSKGGIIQIEKLYKAVNEQFDKWGIPRIPPNQLSAGLSIETRKMIELIRALSVDPEILILDEITQSLSLNNRNKLYEIIKKFKETGRSLIVITHDVEELIAISDSITVLRDGEVVGEVISCESKPAHVKSMMVGREIRGAYYRDDKEVICDNEVVISVNGISVDGELENISFDVHRGEILGFCGLSDSGIHSIGRAVYGLSKIKKGSVYLKTRNRSIKNPTTALKNGMAYVPKDRDNDALMIHTGILENLCLPSLHELQSTLGYISPGKQKKMAAEMCTKLSVKCTNVFQTMDRLSGGNKQKVNLGRWIGKDLEVLILDCSTRGVDVGVKAYIYSIMKELKKKGLTMILISDELTELLGMADRLCIMKGGKITGVIRRDEDFTEQSVIEVMI